MGNTAILAQALANDAIDAYPEYAGTISREILQAGRDLDLAEMNARLAPRGLAASVPLGFSNSYAVGVRARWPMRGNLRASPTWPSIRT